MQHCFLAILYALLYNTIQQCNAMQYNAMQHSVWACCTSSTVLFTMYSELQCPKCIVVLDAPLRSVLVSSIRVFHECKPRAALCTAFNRSALESHTAPEKEFPGGDSGERTFRPPDSLETFPRPVKARVSIALGGKQLSAARLILAHALQTAKGDLQKTILLCVGGSNVSDILDSRSALPIQKCLLQIPPVH